MKVGDLVRVVHARDMGFGNRPPAPWRIGIIIWHKPRPHEHLLEIYRVLSEDGAIDQYTTAAIREVLDESR